MAKDMFLKIDTIEGESMDHKHKGEIEIDSWSWGASQSGTSGHGTGAGAGKVSMQDYHFTMTVNKASPKLMLACAVGQHIPKILFTQRKAGGEQEEFFKLTFSDVLISSYQTGAHGGAHGELPMEQCSFNYSKIEMEYLPQDATGKVGSPVKAGWDVKANKKV